jgi:large-conductance mechanosensitive channel
MSNKTNEGKWIRIVPHSKIFSTKFDFVLILSRPVYHLDNLFNFSSIYPEKWHKNFDLLESIRDSVCAIRYFKENVINTVNQVIKPLINTKGKKEFNEMPENYKKSKNIHIDIEIDNNIYYPFVSSIWNIIILYYSVFDYVIEYNENISKICNELKNKIYQTFSDKNLIRYIRDVKKNFKSFKNVWENKKTKSKNYNTNIWKRIIHIHENLLNTLLIDWDSNNKDFFISFSKAPWIDYGKFSYEEIISECDKLEQELNSFANEVNELSFSILEKNNIKLKQKTNV